MRKRTTTITEQYSPTFRRKRTNINLNLSASSFPVSEDSEQVQRSSRQMKKISENYENFKVNNQRIKDIVDKIDEVIRRRMEVHEIELLEVVKKQISQITSDSHKIVQQYNHMLETKNKQTQIHSLQNQLAYFQHQTKLLFQENKKLRQQAKTHQTLLTTKNDIIQELHQNLTRYSKKLMKQKIHFKAISQCKFTKSLNHSQPPQQNRDNSETLKKIQSPSQKPTQKKIAKRQIKSSMQMNLSNPLENHPKIYHMLKIEKDEPFSHRYRKSDNTRMQTKKKIHKIFTDRQKQVLEKSKNFWKQKETDV